MEKPLTMPKLGMTMEEGTVERWLYHEGDVVERGEPLLEVMTDKVSMEVEAPFTGRLVHILAQDGDTLPIGATLAILLDETGAINRAPTDVPVTESPRHVAPTQSLGSSNTTASVPATESMSPAAPSDAVLTSTDVASTPAAKREAALHNIDLHTIVQSGVTPPLDRADVIAFVQSQQNTTSRPEIQQPSHQMIRATPVAQRIAIEHQVDLATLAERKQGEKVKRADVEAHLANGLQQSSAETHPVSQQVQPPTAEMPLASDQRAEGSELIPLSSIRRLVGQRMLQSITTAPHIYLDTEIDMTEAERCRQRVGHSLEQQGEPMPSLTAVLLRAVAAALVLHPEVNATLEVGGQQGKDAIRRWHAVHIGIAVDTEQALLTPVIRNAHQQSLPALARELRRVTQAARQGKLKPEDMANATFTISNLGMYGIDTFHAIIAPGQSGILAVGKITKRGIVIDEGAGERLEIRPVMKVSLSADHRVLDGAGGSRFLQRVKAFLEDPYLLL